MQLPTRRPKQETREEQEARVQEELRRQQRRKEQEERVAAANICAEELLLSILDEVQKDSLKENDWFLVIGKSGKIYRVKRGRVGNVELLSPEGRVLRSFCVHTEGYIPNSDNIAAQKLHLETDDEKLIEIANVHHDYEQWESGGEVVDIAPYIKRAA